MRSIMTSQPLFGSAQLIRTNGFQAAQVEDGLAASAVIWGESVMRKQDRQSSKPVSKSVMSTRMLDRLKHKRNASMKEAFELERKSMVGFRHQ